MSKAASLAAKQAAQHVIPSITAAKNAAPKLFRYKYERNPDAINICTYAATRDHAKDISHPYHLKVQRRLAAFDPTKLQWNVKCPMDLSKKAVVRNWAIRRVKEAFRAALRERGWRHDGTPMAGEAVEQQLQLKGALAILLDKDKSVLTATSADVQRQSAWLVKKLVEEQHKETRSPARPYGRRVGQPRERHDVREDSWPATLAADG